MLVVYLKGKFEPPTEFLEWCLENAARDEEESKMRSDDNPRRVDGPAVDMAANTPSLKTMSN